jgi:hypothetical protein
MRSVVQLERATERLRARSTARGPFELRLTPKSGGELVVDRGKFVDLFRRQSDGSWKFARVMFNRNRPAA